MRDDSGIVEFGDNPIRHISRALAGSTGQQHDVGEFERVAQPFAQGGDIVMRDAQPPRLAAQFAHGVGEHLAVGVVNLGRLHLFAGRDDFIAGGKNRDDRLSPDIDIRDTDRRQHSRVAAGQQPAAAKHRLARRDVGSGERHPAAGGDRSGDSKFAAAYLGVLDHDDGIGAARHHAAGGDQHRLAGMNHRGRDDAGVNLFVAQEHRARHFFGRAERVFRHHREAIDVRAIERRHVDRRHDVGRQHPAERRVERDDFNAAGRAVDRGPETPLRFIAVEDLEELLLLTHRARPSTSAPAAKPSLSSPTITKPSARVVDDSSDAPAMAIGSTSPSTIFTRA